MTKIVLTLLAGAALAAPVLAEAPALSYSFERDGNLYRVTDTVRDGVRYLDGVDAGNRTFHLRVNKGWVSGDYDGAQVSYAAPAATRLKQTASR